ncbi:MAG: GxxExxY protein [Flavisolibacter sp.]
MTSLNNLYFAGKVTESHEVSQRTTEMDINCITEKIIGCAIEVHKHLGPGLLESTYEACLLYELQKAGLEVKTELGLPLVYKEIKLEVGYRMDFLVENCVVVEIKSVEALNDVHTAQVLTYLKLSNAKIALLINFNVLRLKDGIKRLIGREHYMSSMTSKSSV